MTTTIKKRSRLGPGPAVGPQGRRNHETKKDPGKKNLLGSKGNELAEREQTND